jgi:hypothetical protein
MYTQKMGGGIKENDKTIWLPAGPCKFCFLRLLLQPFYYCFKNKINNNCTLYDKYLHQLTALEVLFLFYSLVYFNSEFKN